jgi:hypothetical protein
VCIFDSLPLHILKYTTIPSPKNIVKARNAGAEFASEKSMGACVNYISIETLHCTV